MLDRHALSWDQLPETLVLFQKPCEKWNLTVVAVEIPVETINGLTEASEVDADLSKVFCSYGRLWPHQWNKVERGLPPRVYYPFITSRMIRF